MLSPDTELVVSLVAAMMTFLISGSGHGVAQPTAASQPTNIEAPAVRQMASIRATYRRSLQIAKDIHK